MKSKTKQSIIDSTASKRLILFFGIVGTIVIATSLAWNIKLDRDSILEATRVQARSAYEKDLVYRRWNASHGGVYVPPTEQTPPNPYLDFIPDRDVITTEGQRLTLVNPAYMTRQVFDLGNEAYGIRSHITSLKPIRPENAADTWEIEALKAFEKGIEEVSSIEQLDGKDYLRLMKPLVTEKQCLKCHEKQGYKVGDIRGGISVSIPMESKWKSLFAHQKMLIFSYMLILLVGGVGLYAGFLSLKHSERKRKKLLNELLDNNFFLEESQSIARLGTYALDITTGFWTSSKIIDEIFGIGSDFERNFHKWVEIIHPDDRERMQNYFNQQVLTEHKQFDCKYRIIRVNDQQERWVHGLGKLSFDEQDNPIRMIGTIQDITERKQASIKLKTKIAQLKRLNKNMIGRELKMIEMKKEVDNLCEKAGLPRRYNITDE